MIELSKSEKRILRELAGRAHEIELNAELGKLEQAFSSWKEHRLDAFTLDGAIHEYHSGPHKNLFNYYVQNSNTPLIVARALAIGLLSKSDLPDELFSRIKPAVELFREEAKSID